MAGNSRKQRKSQLDICLRTRVAPPNRFGGQLLMPGFATLLRLGPARAPLANWREGQHVGRNRSAGQDLLPPKPPAQATPIGRNLVLSGNSLQNPCFPAN